MPYYKKQGDKDREDRVFPSLTASRFLVVTALCAV